jgi:hypothetical protein
MAMLSDSRKKENRYAMSIKPVEFEALRQLVSANYFRATSESAKATCRREAARKLKGSTDEWLLSVLNDWTVALFDVFGVDDFTWVEETAMTTSDEEA